MDRLADFNLGRPRPGFRLAGRRKTDDQNVDVKAVGRGRTELLSGGKWFLLQIEPQDVPKKLPKEVALLGYEFQVASPGTISLKPDRLGGHPLAVRFAHRPGSLAAVKPDYPTTDHVELAFWCPMGWMKLGQTGLAAGERTLEFRISAWSEEDIGKDVFQGIMFACDATCLTRAPSGLTASTGPTRTGRAQQDKQAAGQF